MEIDFLAHASFLFTNDEGRRFMLDPYESGGFSGRVGYSPIDVSPDVIIITHDHLDHNHTQTIPGNFKIIRYEGVAYGVPIRSVQVYHDMFQGSRFGGIIDAKIFIIDGITICHCGDIGEVLDDPNKLNAFGKIDILIIPTGGFYTLGPDGAAEVTHKLKPKIVIPCHYKASKCGFDIVTVDPFLKHFKRVHRHSGSSIVVSKDSLPESTECVVLEMRYDQ